MTDPKHAPDDQPTPDEVVVPEPIDTTTEEGAARLAEQYSGEYVGPQAPTKPAPQNTGPVIYVRLTSGAEYVFADEEARAMRGAIRQRLEKSCSISEREPIYIDTKSEDRETCILPQYIESFDWYPKGLP